MRPNGDEVLRGVQGSLLTYVLPELQSEYARTELMLASALLSIVGSELDGAAQRLVDDNAALRALALRGAAAIDAAPLADELRALAAETDASLRLSDLRAANDRARAVIARLAVHVEESGTFAELRTEIFAYLRDDAESRSHALLGPRSDG
jgi:hypothetical protein